MKHRQFWQGVVAALSMAVLILDGKTALEGARNGIELCLETVIPSLFPFFVLSILMTSAFSGMSPTVLRPLGRLCRIPKGFESILISGFLGGYPVGAQCISQAYQCGNLEKDEAQHLLTFCNNAGPAFLFGMVSSLFPDRWMIWALWGIHIISAVLCAVILPGGSGKSTAITSVQDVTLSTALSAAVRVMASVCGWVVIFRVIISFLKRWCLWIFPTNVQTALIGFLELSNGCSELLFVEDISLRFLICSCILAFGGLCVTMQTLSVIGTLSPSSYFLGKCLQTIFSLLISVGILYRIWLPFAAVLGFSCLISKKGVAFKRTLMYNDPNKSRRIQYAVSEKDGTFLHLLPLRRSAGKRADSLRQKGPARTG